MHSRHKIAHITICHPRDDSRILYKQAATIASNGNYDVELFVQDGAGDRVHESSGVLIRDTGERMPRLRRMTVGGWKMFRAVIRARPAIVHFHDPELIPWGVLLSLFGMRIVYDVHEDYPEAVSQNRRFSPLLRRLLPPVVRFVEWVTAPFMSGIVSVTPQIAKRFPKQKTVLVRNYPIVGEFHEPADSPMSERPREIAFIGTISMNRNILGMLDAIEEARDADVILRLAGSFTVDEDEVAARAHPGWGQVRYDGWVSRDDIAGILTSARAGLVVIKPVPHEMVGLPIKLFEYMAAGMPIIASDFPVWREILEDSGCGLLVDPLKLGEIADAIRWIINHPSEAEVMGINGRLSVLAKYNWEKEAEVLLRLYDRILPANS